jgi:TRAP-type mannitol/chloroaromatic compound transport system permease small subunit
VMFGAAHTLRMNEHVRVDVLYGALSARARLWIDLLGGIFFLLPMCLLMIHFTWPWFVESYVEGETSANAGGLLRWPVKLALPLGFALVALQGISEIVKCLAALAGLRPGIRSYERPVQ